MKIKKTLIIKNRLGLHARAAAQFVKTSNRFLSEIFLSKGRQTVNGKSIMGLLTLAAATNSKVVLQCEGPDAKEAIRALSDLIDSKFGEK